MFSTDLNVTSVNECFPLTIQEVFSTQVDIDTTMEARDESVENSLFQTEPYSIEAHALKYNFMASIMTNNNSG